MRELPFSFKKLTPAIEVVWASTTQLRPTLGHTLTGWVPRKQSLVDGMDLYW